MLAVVGAVMLVVDRWSRDRRPIGEIRLSDVLFIGLAQACALIPGVSRSGATMTAGLARGLNRADAARFAFLLGTPTFTGAALLELPELVSTGGDRELALVGAIVAGLVGLVAVHGLLAFLQRQTLIAFVVYRFVLAGVVFAAIAIQ